MDNAKCLKRAIASIALTRPVGFSLPFRDRPTPSPHIIFSLKKYAGERAAPSNTTKRTELEPMSITPTFDRSRIDGSSKTVSLKRGGVTARSCIYYSHLCTFLTTPVSHSIIVGSTINLWLQIIKLT